MKEYTLIHPDIDRGSGRTRELIDELVSLWRLGKNEGAGEIAAVAELLSSEDALPNIYFRQMPDGVVQRFSVEFLNFIVRSKISSEPVIEYAKRHWRSGEIPLRMLCTSSATGALYSILVALDAAGGEVITTSLNFPGVINAILMAGAVPKFVDIDEKSFCMDTAEIKKAVSKKTRAIILTHLNRLIDISPLCELYENKNFDLPLIQDASLAIGSTCGGMRPGFVNLGTCGATVASLATSKIISGLGGGIMFANNEEFTERVLCITHQGKSLRKGTELVSRGANFKICDINAAIAFEMLKRRDAIFEKRRKLKTLYDKALMPLAKSGRIVLQDAGSEAVVSHYAVLLKKRDDVALKLYNQYRIYLGSWPIHHTQKIYKNLPWVKNVHLPVTEKIADRFAFLPFHTRLEKKDVEFICDALKKEL